MKKTVLLISLAVVASLLVLGVCIIANAIFGNPISKLVATFVAKDYVSENYSDDGYGVYDVSYSFKDGYYHAFVSSEAHLDGDFTVRVTPLGRISDDDYQYRVTERGNIANRLCSEYRDRVDEVLESEDFPYTCHIAFGDLEFDGEVGEEFPENAIMRNELVNGVRYDIDELGRTNGKIVLYIDTDKADLESAASVLLDVKRIMDEAGINFYWIDLNLRLVDGEGNVIDEGLGIRNFKYADICDDGLLQKVTDAKKRTDEYFERLDKEKEIN